ncbi:hypothetical protein RJT34_16609 [Clitoria ternatea]|uniref:Uncharacterized protein n=1 Tax=Clitoria ternatea TaxID=43366 RepID=A0AAN9PD04_CLITE
MTFPIIPLHGRELAEGFQKSSVPAPDLSIPTLIWKEAVQSLNVPTLDLSVPTLRPAYLCLRSTLQTKIELAEQRAYTISQRLYTCLSRRSQR